MLKLRLFLLLLAALLPAAVYAQGSTTAAWFVEAQGPACFGPATGYIKAQAPFGPATTITIDLMDETGLVVLQSQPSFFAEFTGLAADTYRLRAVNSATSETAWYFEPVRLTVQEQEIIIVPTILHQCWNSGTCSQGSISLYVPQDPGTFTYLWTNGATTRDITGLVPGNYSVTVTTPQGCTRTQGYSIVSRGLDAVVAPLSGRGLVGSPLAITPGNATGDFLRWDGTQWAPFTQVSGNNGNGNGGGGASGNTFPIHTNINLSTANVGIGTASPSARLDVNGDVRIGGGTQLDGPVTMTGIVQHIPPPGGGSGGVVVVGPGGVIGTLPPPSCPQDINGHSYWILGGNNMTAPPLGEDCRLGTNNAFGFGIETNDQQRMLFRADGNIIVSSPTAFGTPLPNPAFSQHRVVVNNHFTGAGAAPLAETALRVTVPVSPTSPDAAAFAVTGAGNSYPNSAGEERFVVTNAGNVGVGVAAPAQRLHVEGNAVVTGRMQIEGGVIQRGGAPITATSDLGLYSLEPSKWIRLASNNANIRFFTDATDASPTGQSETFCVHSGRSVHIGTVSDPATLNAHGRVVVDAADQNTGTLDDFSLRFGVGTEGIASQRTPGPGQWGLDLYTAGQQRVHISNGGNVGIGTVTPAARLHISVPVGTNADTRVMQLTREMPNGPAHNYILYADGRIYAKRVRVAATNVWPDFVFEPGHQPVSPDSLEQYIRENGRLPWMPSAEEIEAEGMDVYELVRAQQQAIEELTLMLLELRRTVNSPQTTPSER